MRLLLAKSKLFLTTALLGVVLCTACSQLKQPEPEPFFAETPPPPKQEFKWSNGTIPKSIDPALASTAPATDITRALFDGLTDLDPVSLDAVPAVAEKWESENNDKTWRFHLRENAKWTNGERVTANDFVRSWKRLAEMGDKAAHRSLLLNIRGANISSQTTEDPSAPDFLSETASALTATPSPSPSPSSTPSPAGKANEFGVIAEGEDLLRVELLRPDKDFPRLAAHPIFRPMFEKAIDLQKKPKADEIVTNGAFRFSAIESDGLILDRSDSYWGKEDVKLERVHFMAFASAEKALDAYRSGSVDAVTNTEFSPAALKLLEPFEDFRRTSHSAINFYEFNTTRAPFNDRRVRRALAIAIEREKLTDGELQGTPQPANKFMPAGSGSSAKIIYDVAEARTLLDEAGFPDGANFPKVRLLINRNDTQQRVARTVAQMWKDNLGIETEIIVKESAEIEVLKNAGDFDLVRRGVVMPTSDETANLLSIFGIDEIAVAEPQMSPTPDADGASGPSVTEAETPGVLPDNRVLTEDAALYELHAIPLYFPSSYTLIKPYVRGFDSNALDAPSLRSVEIDGNWQKPKAK